MVTPATSAQWGQVGTVREPASTATVPAVGPGVQITDQQVSGMIPSEWPAPRTWTISAVYERADDATLQPRVKLAVEYGIGAAAYASEVDVTAAGLVLGVTAQNVAASSRVLPAVIGSGGLVTVKVSATPGPPVLGVVSQVVPYGALAPAGLARARAPRGAVALVATTVPYAAGIAGAPVDATATWQYLLTSGVGVALSGVVTLAQAGAGTFKPLELGVAVPVAANAVTLVDVGAGGYHYLSWRVMQ